MDKQAGRALTAPDVRNPSSGQVPPQAAHTRTAREAMVTRAAAAAAASPSAAGAAAAAAAAVEAEQEEEKEEEEEEEEEEDGVITATKTQRAFQPGWLESFKGWLRWDAVREAMFCTVCERHEGRTAKGNNKFAGAGSRNFRLSALHDHERAGYHKEALQQLKAARRYEREQQEAARTERRKRAREEEEEGEEEEDDDDEEGEEDSDGSSVEGGGGGGGGVRTRGSKRKRRPNPKFGVFVAPKPRAPRSKKERLQDQKTLQERNDEAFDRVVAHLVRQNRPISEFHSTVEFLLAMRSQLVPDDPREMRRYASTRLQPGQPLPASIMQLAALPPSVAYAPFSPSNSPARSSSSSSVASDRRSLTSASSSIGSDGGGGKRGKGKDKGKGKGNGKRAAALDWGDEEEEEEQDDMEGMEEDSIGGGMGGGNGGDGGGASSVGSGGGGGEEQEEEDDIEEPRGGGGEGTQQGQQPQQQGPARITGMWTNPQKEPAMTL